jgi:hypothetical protein
VRIFTGLPAARTARALGARAFTVGHDIAFSHGQYAPDTSAGRALLAHELAHVAQQQAPGAAAPGVAFLKKPEGSPESVVRQQLEEMNSDMRDNEYKAALNAYAVIESLGPDAFNLAPSGTTASTIHYLAATAARALGDTERYRELLQRAQTAMGTETTSAIPGGLEALEGELASVEAAFGPVDIKVRSKKGNEMSAARLVFTGMSPDPNVLKSIQHAQAVLDRDGAFSGMLPFGDYTLGEESFTVVAGKTTKVRSRE